MNMNNFEDKKKFKFDIRLSYILVEKITPLLKTEFCVVRLQNNSNICYQHLSNRTILTLFTAVNCLSNTEFFILIACHIGVANSFQKETSSLRFKILKLIKNMGKL